MLPTVLTVLFSLPFILIGLAMLFMAINYYRTTLELFKKGYVATGTIIRFDTSDGGDGETFYHPVVKFWTRTEKVYEFKDEFATTSPGYEPGNEVRVVYDPENPQMARIKSGRALWFIPTILLIFGISFTTAGLVIFSQTFR